MNQGKLDEAIAEYRAAIELNPKYAYAHTNLGNALYRQGKLDEAIACFRQAIEIEPKLATAHSNMGVALFAQGKLSEAIACYRQVIDINPKLAPVYNNSAWNLATADDREPATPPKPSSSPKSPCSSTRNLGVLRTR